MTTSTFAPIRRGSRKHMLRENRTALNQSVCRKWLENHQWCSLSIVSRSCKQEILWDSMIGHMFDGCCVPFYCPRFWIDPHPYISERGGYPEWGWGVIGGFGFCSLFSYFLFIPFLRNPIKCLDYIRTYDLRRMRSCFILNHISNECIRTRWMPLFCTISLICCIIYRLLYIIRLITYIYIYTHM